MINIVRHKKYLILLLVFVLAPIFCFAQEESSTENKLIDYFRNPLKIFSQIKSNKDIDNVIKSPQETTDYILNETELGSQLDPGSIGETIKNEISKEVDRQIEAQKEKIKSKAWNMIKEMIEKIVNGLIESIKEIFERS